MVTSDPAYTEFVLARQARLRRVAYLLCGDAALAEDLLQEALIALASRWESVDNPDAFVRRVIYRQRVSSWRKQRHEVVRDELPDRGVPDGADDRARDQEVHDALRALPPRQRAALVLRYFEDLTEAQTAEVMGVRLGTVKSLSHQAVARMRAELEARRASQREREGTR
ncbi:SigE family RNA polymerase sigma factor [Ornithinimicrobium humiphilum]|uniref:RNA polymerase sigma-70 factor (Sigma-E family) n=1 Tax=Ornithinimicrobium humiphilum TaxID=125288 RepID=A0A543KPX3_9MICO|nr:SigE family RNA polymerase sigma factor [Ornithinimicrobium humiphilum]TQM97121.1 RNA polymerase sigma-70 factor (sigma-E family) [Ornithinimicrobium humiphilum]